MGFGLKTCVKGRAVIRTIFSFHGSGAFIHNGDDPRAVDGLCGGGGATEAGSSWLRWRDQRPCRRIWPPANSGEGFPSGRQVPRRRRRVEGVGV